MKLGVLVSKGLEFLVRIDLGLASVELFLQLSIFQGRGLNLDQHGTHITALFKVTHELGQSLILLPQLGETNLIVLDVLSQLAEALLVLLQLNDELIQVLVGLHETVILGPEFNEFVLQVFVFLLNDQLDFRAV